MIVLKETFSKDNHEFIEGEYYNTEQDENYIYVFDDLGEMIILTYNKAKQHIK